MIFSFFFGYIFNVDSGNLPYPVFAYLGLTTWIYFTNILNQGSNSLSENQNLIRKIYFPRIILPISKVISGGFDFLMSTTVLLLLLPLYQYKPTIELIFVPFFILYNILFGLTMCLLLSAMALKKRDLYHLIPFLTGFGIWLTPVFYSTSLFPAEWQFIFYLNPVATVVEGYRWSFEGGAWPAIQFLYNIPVVIGLFFIAVYAFRKIETKIVEHI